MSRPEVLFPLFAGLETLDGVGAKTAQAFEALEVRRPKDLLFLLPHSGTDRSRRDSVRDVTAPATVTVEVEVGSHLPPRRKGGPYRVNVRDAKLDWALIFFHARGDFLERCGLPTDQHPVWNEADAPILADGLRALEDWDCRDRAGTVDLVLAGRQDPIVGAAMTSACFPSTRIEWQDGGHLLPLTDPGWCAEKIRRVVETLT